MGYNGGEGRRCGPRSEASGCRATERPGVDAGLLWSLLGRTPSQSPPVVMENPHVVTFFFMNSVFVNYSMYGLATLLFFRV